MRLRAIAGALAGLVLLLAAADQAAAQSPGSIVVEGNRRVDASTVRSYFESAGGKLDDAALDAGLKRLLATRLFETAEIKRDGGQIKVHVVEAPLIGKIAFEGNKKIEDKKLTAVVQSKAGGALQKPTVQADVLKEKFDVVLLSCKAFDLEDAIKSFAPAVGPQTAIIPLLNGMLHLDVLDKKFGRERVLGGLCAIAVTLNEKREVVHLAPMQSLNFGERDGKMSDRVRAIAKVMSSECWRSW